VKLLSRIDGYSKVIIENKLDIILLIELLKKGFRVRKEIFWREKIESGLKTKRGKPIESKVTLDPINIVLDTNLETLRITGRVIEATYSDIIGRLMGVDIKLHDIIEIQDSSYLDTIISKRREEVRILTIIFDIDGYTIAEIGDTIRILEEKFISTKAILNEDEDDFKKEMNNIIDILSTYKKKGYFIIMGYNTGTKRISKIFKKHVDISLEGINSTGINGVLEIIRKLKNRNEIVKNTLAKTQLIYEEILSLKGDGIIYGIDDVLQAIKMKIINSLIIDEKLLFEEGNIEMVFRAFMQCIDITIVNPNTSLGRYIQKYGGIIGIPKWIQR